MKKICFILVCFAFLFLFSGCSSSKDITSENPYIDYPYSTTIDGVDDIIILGKTEEAISEFIAISSVHNEFSTLFENESPSSSSSAANESYDSSPFLIESHEIKEPTSPFYHIVYVLENISDRSLVFSGISIKEFDSQNTILGDYYSYNKHAMDTIVEPGQKVRLDLTFSKEDGIARIESDECCFYFTEDETTQHSAPLDPIYIVDPPM